MNASSEGGENEGSESDKAIRPTNADQKVASCGKVSKLSSSERVCLQRHEQIRGRAIGSSKQDSARIYRWCRWTQ
jgi:hypothetical protein